jgi:alkylated DNA repair protein alkB family protein 8
MTILVVIMMIVITLMINNIVKIESYIFLLILSYLIKCRNVKMASAESVNTSEDVKAENPTVPGFVLIENFITEEEEVELLEEINKGRWVSNRTKDRRVQVFGPYHDTNYKIIPGKFSEHPEWAQKLAKRIQKLNIDSNSRKLTDPKRCEGYTNEYSDGVELYYHTDHRSTYDECIYGVSLNCDGYLGFKPVSGFAFAKKIKIPRRSLYIMAGESRYNYKHGISPGWVEDTRVSVTFRTINK